MQLEWTTDRNPDSIGTYIVTLRDTRNARVVSHMRWVGRHWHTEPGWNVIAWAECPAPFTGEPALNETQRRQLGAAVERALYLIRDSPVSTRYDVQLGAALAFALEQDGWILVPPGGVR